MGNTLCYAKNFLKLIFVGVESIYNVVFVSDVQQSESVTQIHISKSSSLNDLLFCYSKLPLFFFLNKFIVNLL